jgi:hypothetical protein
MSFVLKEEKYVILDMGSWRVKARLGVKEKDSNLIEPPSVVSAHGLYRAGVSWSSTRRRGFFYYTSP